MNRIRFFITRILPLAVLFILAIIVGGYSIESNEVKKIVEDSAKNLQTNINIVWTLIAAVLVFFMQAGFAMVESGFTRAKNAVNIIMKNLMDFSIGSISFFILGFGLMFGATNGFFGTTHFALSGTTSASGDWNFTFMIFQTVFAATAATIVSGAMAERTKFKAYLVYSFFISALIYPIFGSWAWGGLLDGGGWLEAGKGGFLDSMSLPGFLDFAGSTVVHSIGGWLALAGAIMLGPRIGKYGPDGSARAIPGHNLSLAALGVFILWFGWFGFNAGSTTTGEGLIGYIALTTNLSAAAGAFFAMMTSWILFKKPDVSMALNGALAGLVAITSPCDGVSPMGAIIIGAIGGVLVVFSVIILDKKFKIDDPVGAVSVHGVVGAWGTLSAGLFNLKSGLFYGHGFSQLITQFIGVVTAFIWAFGIGLVLFYALKKTMGLRVSKEEEMKGLDISEHGMEAYEGFQIFTTK